MRHAEQLAQPGDRLGTILAIGLTGAIPRYLVEDGSGVGGRVRLQGGIFDIDGVLLDTPHERAWREALATLMGGPWRALAPRTTYSPEAFTGAVYQEYVAGKPRLAGATAALAYFRVPDPDGSRAGEYAATKQTTLERLAAGADIRVYDDALRFLLAVKAAGVRVCAASS